VLFKVNGKLTSPLNNGSRDINQNDERGGNHMHVASIASDGTMDTMID
jgi:hypothetical protein